MKQIKNIWEYFISKNIGITFLPPFMLFLIFITDPSRINLVDVVKNGELVLCSFLLIASSYINNSRSGAHSTIHLTEEQKNVLEDLNKEKEKISKSSPFAITFFLIPYVIIKTNDDMNFSRIMVGSIVSIILSIFISISIEKNIQNMNEVISGG